MQRLIEPKDLNFDLKRAVAMKVLITGAAGFIGSYLVNKLQSKYEVVTKEST